MLGFTWQPRQCMAAACGVRKEATKNRTLLNKRRPYVHMLFYTGFLDYRQEFEENSKIKKNHGNL
jgi:hypothetical protein